MLLTIACYNYVFRAIIYMKGVDKDEEKNNINVCFNNNFYWICIFQCFCRKHWDKNSNR